MRGHADTSSRGDADVLPADNLARKGTGAELHLSGFLDLRSPEALTDRLRGFRQGLRESGYVEGDNAASRRRGSRVAARGARAATGRARCRDERAPRHSITSSARASNLSGIWRPSAFAVLRLM